MTTPEAQQAELAVGYVVSLPPYYQLRMMVDALPPAKVTAEIAVLFGMERKTYTMEEFLHLLGFNIAPVPGQKVPGQ